MITNKLSLPAPLVRAVEADPYEKGACDFSATELIAPPYMKKLQREHADTLEVDAADRIWSLMGSAIHGILERGDLPGYVMERRYIGSFELPDGQSRRVGAKIDVLNTDTWTLDDYKVTSVYKFKAGLDGFMDIPEEYEAQINIQAECIFRETGHEVKHGRIIGLLRDWRRSEALREQGYPQFQVAVMPIPIWPQARRAAYIVERIQLHMASEPPPCRPAERWERPPVWALMKKGQKKAMRLYSAEADATAAYLTLVGAVQPDGYSVVHRLGARTRCASYCEVAAHCPDYQAYLAAQPQKEAST